MATTDAPVRIRQSREALEEFIDAMHEAQSAVHRLGRLACDELDRQVFESITALITNTASAIWDKSPHAGQFIEDYVHGLRSETTR